MDRDQHRHSGQGGHAARPPAPGHLLIPHTAPGLASWSSQVQPSRPPGPSQAWPQPQPTAAGFEGRNKGLGQLPGTPRTEASHKSPHTSHSGKGRCLGLPGLGLRAGSSHENRPQLEEPCLDRVQDAGGDWTSGRESNPSPGLKASPGGAGGPGGLEASAHLLAGPPPASQREDSARALPPVLDDPDQPLSSLGSRSPSLWVHSWLCHSLQKGGIRTYSPGPAWLTSLPHHLGLTNCGWPRGARGQGP